MVEKTTTVYYHKLKKQPKNKIVEKRKKKMTDLRTQKTLGSIETTFISMREKKKLENIKVSELCSIALINKTTFYNYYQDIYELSEHIENKYLSQCFSGFDGYDCLFSDTKKFIVGIYNNFKSNQTIQIIFNDRINFLVDKAQKYLLELYKKQINTEDKKMCILFLIQGAFYILFNHNAKENDKLNILIELAQLIVSNKFN